MRDGEHITLDARLTERGYELHAEADGEQVYLGTYKTDREAYRAGAEYAMRRLRVNEIRPANVGTLTWQDGLGKA